jgi:hypothetical protein
MSQQPDDWQLLQKTWQGYQPDFTKIAKRNRWLEWRMSIILVLDILVLIGYAAFWWHSMQTDPTYIKVWHSLMGVVLLFGIYIEFKIRWPLLRVETHSNQQILQLYLKRVEAGVLLGRWGRWFCQALWLPALIFVAYGYSSQQQPDIEKYLYSAIFVSLWLFMFWFLMRWYEQKKLSELEKLRQLWHEFIDEPLGNAADDTNNF